MTDVRTFQHEDDDGRRWRTNGIDVWGGFGLLRRIYYTDKGEIYPQPPGEATGNSARFMVESIKQLRVASTEMPGAWMLWWREMDRTAYRDVPNPLRLVRAGETTEEEFLHFLVTMYRVVDDRPTHNLPEEP